MIDINRITANKPEEATGYILCKDGVNVNYVWFYRGMHFVLTPAGWVSFIGFSETKMSEIVIDFKG